MLKISNYSFGKIKINKKIYTKDLILCGDRIHSGWRREQGHNLSLNDLGLITDYQPDTLFIGTGKFGLMQVKESLVQALKKQGIPDIIIEKSSKVVELYNHCEQPKKSLAIHLSC